MHSSDLVYTRSKRAILHKNLVELFHQFEWNFAFVKIDVLIKPANIEHITNLER